MAEKRDIVIVGGGYIAAEYGHFFSAMGSKVTVIGRNRQFIPEEERILHYAACDVAVFPSFYEPFGIVALEAMAMEKPVVVGARGVSGLREIVVASGPDMTGYHINPYDPQVIAWGVNSVLGDEGHMKEMGKNGRKRAISEFTWEKTARNVFSIYEKAACR